MFESLFPDSNGEEDYATVVVDIAGKLYTLHLADSDSNSSKKTLFATHLWQGAICLGRYMVLLGTSIAWETTSVVELGAGGGLPSMVGLSLGAKTVAATDFPADLVLANLARNLTAHAEAVQANSNISVVKHLWGSDVADIVELNSGQKFTVVLAAECLWKHEQHALLLQSIDALLADNGIAFISFSHHIPGLEKEDLRFFEFAENDFHFKVKALQTVEAPHMWDELKKSNIYIYSLEKGPF
jgi:nicotinamide N-methyltransferase